MNSFEQVQRLARNALDYFYCIDAGETFFLRFDAPAWINDLIAFVHDGNPQNDWDFLYLVKSLEFIANANSEDQLDDGNAFEPEYSYARLLRWLADAPIAREIVDDVLLHDDNTTHGGLFCVLQTAQDRHQGLVYERVLEYLRDRVDPPRASIR